MGGAFSSSGDASAGNTDGEESDAARDPAGITPIGRGSNGELIYHSRDQRQLVAAGGGSSLGGVRETLVIDPIPSPPPSRLSGNDEEENCSRRNFFIVGIAVAIIILIILVVVLSLLLLSSNDDKGESVDRGSIFDSNQQSFSPTTAEETSATISPSSRTATTATPSSPAQTTPPPTVLPVSEATIPPASIGPAPPSCTVCADGVPVRDEYQNRFGAATPAGRNLTCGQLETEISSFAEDRCFQLQLLGSYNCGCVMPHPNAVCHLCAAASDGNGASLLPPQEFRHVEINELGGDGRNLTCMDVYLEAAQYGNTTERCRWYQDLYGAHCACPSMTESSPSPSSSASLFAPTMVPTVVDSAPLTLAPTAMPTFLSPTNIPSSVEPPAIPTFGEMSFGTAVPTFGEISFSTATPTFGEISFRTAPPSEGGGDPV